MVHVLANFSLLCMIAVPITLATGHPDVGTYGGALFWVGFLTLIVILVTPGIGKARRKFLTVPMGEHADYPPFLMRLYEQEPLQLALAEAFHWTTASLICTVIGFALVLMNA